MPWLCFFCGNWNLFRLGKYEKKNEFNLEQKMMFLRSISQSEASEKLHIIKTILASFCQVLKWFNLAGESLPGSSCSCCFCCCCSTGLSWRKRILNSLRQATNRRWLAISCCRCRCRCLCCCWTGSRGSCVALIFNAWNLLPCATQKKKTKKEDKYGINITE